MPTQQEQESSIKTKERKQLREKRFIIAIVAILFLVGGIVLGILSTQGIVQGSWSSILPMIFTVLGVVIRLFQWLFPISASSPQAVAMPPPAPPTPIIVHVPQPTTVAPAQSSA